MPRGVFLVPDFGELAAFGAEDSCPVMVTGLPVGRRPDRSNVPVFAPVMVHRADVTASPVPLQNSPQVL
jgi:hypothetical protein